MSEHFTYWVRTAAGLEKIFLRELQRSFGLGKYSMKHKSVFFTLKENAADETLFLSSLRTADDIYAYHGSCSGIDHTKASVAIISSYFERRILPVVVKVNPRFVRVTVSFLGSRNFNRFYVERALNSLLFSNPGINARILSNEKEETWTAGETRIRIHIEDEEAFFGIGLQDKPLHRRTWRADSYPAQLHPPLAAAMAMIAGDLNLSTIIDPFCGSGTILIESALQRPAIPHIGYDVAEPAISTASMNASLVGVNIKFYQDDFYNHYTSTGEYVIVTNPPWGEKHEINSGDLFFTRLSAEIGQSKGAVILVPDELIPALDGHSPERVLQTRVRGKLASVITISK
jgi:23S rRNA G2445 N2-methylase RlmL